MSDKAKEGCWVGGLKVVHALITMFSLGKLPIVVFFHIRIQGIIAFGLWMAYTVALYGITLVYENDKKLSNRDIFNAIGFGMLLAVIKGSLDTIGEMIYTYENRFIAIETQIELLIFGVILFLVLQLKVAKKRILVIILNISIMLQQKWNCII